MVLVLVGVAASFAGIARAGGGKGEEGRFTIGGWPEDPRGTASSRIRALSGFPISSRPLVTMGPRDTSGAATWTVLSLQIPRRA